MPLELHQDPRFTRRIAAIQRAGWVVMGLVIAAALLGLFGAGPLSRATAEAADGTLRLEYDRFGRLSAPGE